MKVQFHTLDVFTTERFGGNPLAVVLDASGISSARMQQIAREFNLSETVFVLPAEHAAHSAKVRIFTPTRELPFAGHPTVGTAILLAEVQGKLRPGFDDAIVVLEEGVGAVRAAVKRKAGTPDHAEFDAPKLPEPLNAPPSNERLAVALGLAPSEIGFENHRPTRYSAGIPFTFVPVRGLDAIGRAGLMASYWPDAFGDGGGAFLYCRETAHTNTQFHARMFIPDCGEDPATGSAVAAFAAPVLKFDDMKTGTHRLLIEQGYEMGRPSQIGLELTILSGQLKSVRIGGHAVPVSSGSIEVG